VTLPSPALTLAAAILTGVAAAGCSTTGAFTKCNPVMVQCNPADYPPLTATLPKSPIPPAASRWVEVYGKDTP
jgi:hypothetical protein